MKNIVLILITILGLASCTPEGVHVGYISNVRYFNQDEILPNIYVMLEDGHEYAVTSSRSNFDRHLYKIVDNHLSKNIDYNYVIVADFANQTFIADSILYNSAGLNGAIEVMKNRYLSNIEPEVTKPKSDKGDTSEAFFWIGMVMLGFFVTSISCYIISLSIIGYKKYEVLKYIRKAKSTDMDSMRFKLKSQGYDHILVDEVIKEINKELGYDNKGYND